MFSVVDSCVIPASKLSIIGMFRTRQLPALSGSSSRSPPVRRSMTVRSRCSLWRYRISSSDAFPRWADLSRQSFRILLPSAVTVFPKSLRFGMDSQCNMINFPSPFRNSELVVCLSRYAISQISLPVAARQGNSFPELRVGRSPEPLRNIPDFTHCRRATGQLLAPPVCYLAPRFSASGLLFISAFLNSQANPFAMRSHGTEK